MTKDTQKDTFSKTCSNCDRYKRMTKNKGLCQDFAKSLYLTNTESNQTEIVHLAVHKNITCNRWAKIDEYNRKIIRAKNKG